MTHRPAVAGTGTLVGSLCAMALSVAVATTFSVNPTRIELTTHHRTDILTLSNSGDEPLRMQVRPMRWSMAVDGQWQLTPSDDLIITPELIEIAPGKSAQLRVGSLLDAGASEVSFRLLLNELPNLNDGKSAPSPQIRVLTEVSLPVFVEPAQATRVPVLRSASIGHGELIVGIGDNGTRRLDPQSVRVTVTDRTGRTLVHRDLMANYVLPGSTWPLRSKLPAGVCRQATSVTVAWSGLTGKSLTHPITSGAEACEGTSSP